VNQISGTTPADAQAEQQDESRPLDAGTSIDASEVGQPGFGARGRMRRRARFLRKARELAYRDLGGLVFNLHRFGQRNDTLVMAKLTTLGHIDAELRSIEGTLETDQPVTVLREAGITACARCAAIHSSEDHFCPNCGLSMGPHVDLPIAGAPAAPAPAPASAEPVAPSPTTTPAPAARADRAPVATSAPSAPASTTPSPPAHAPSSPAEATREWQQGAETPDQGAAPDADSGPQPPTGAPATAPPSEEEDEPTEILHPPASDT
jgi:hypothetical protein